MSELILKPIQLGIITLVVWLAATIKKYKIFLLLIFLLFSSACLHEAKTTYKRESQLKPQQIAKVAISYFSLKPVDDFFYGRITFNKFKKIFSLGETLGNINPDKKGFLFIVKNRQSKKSHETYYFIFYQKLTITSPKIGIELPSKIAQDILNELKTETALNRIKPAEESVDPLLDEGLTKRLSLDALAEHAAADFDAVKIEKKLVGRITPRNFVKAIQINNDELPEDSKINLRNEKEGFVVVLVGRFNAGTSEVKDIMNGGVFVFYPEPIEYGYEHAVLLPTNKFEEILLNLIKFTTLKKV